MRAPSKSSRSPGRRRRALRARACQVPSGCGWSSVIPTRAEPRRAVSWAGMTRVSLTTSRSPGSEEGREVADVPVLECLADDEQPRRVARARRVLRDAVGRKMEIEVAGQHRSCSASRSSCPASMGQPSAMRARVRASAACWAGVSTRRRCTGTSRATGSPLRVIEYSSPASIRARNARRFGWRRAG